jgi:hypothetical protein
VSQTKLPPGAVTQRTSPACQTPEGNDAVEKAQQWLDRAKLYTEDDSGVQSTQRSFPLLRGHSLSCRPSCQLGVCMRRSESPLPMIAVMSHYRGSIRRGNETCVIGHPKCQNDESLLTIYAVRRNVELLYLSYMNPNTT